MLFEINSHRVCPTSCAALIVLLTSTAASAGVHTQGVHTQGVHTQGVHTQGVYIGWLQGPRLRATLSDNTTIEIVHFAGDRVHALAFHRATAEQTTVVLKPEDLVGMRWLESQCDDTTCLQRTYRIAGVQRDRSTNTMPMAPDNSDVVLYKVEYTSGPEFGHGAWRDACESGDIDDDMGLFVDGRFDRDGSWHPDGYTFSCSRGVVAKCVRAWGYKPWKTMETPTHGKVDMQPLHIACTRAARAEYCVDGASYTQDGTLIDMFDIYGLNVPESQAGFILESTWNEQTALSLRHPRITGLMPECRVPSIAPGSGWASQAGQGSALIYVWSDPAHRPQTHSP